MSFTLTPAAPFDGEDVLPLAEAKLFLKVDGDDEDPLIGAMRDAAIDWVERYTSKALARREWTWTTDCFADALRPPIGPIVEVSAIEYFDETATVPVQVNGWRVTAGTVMAAAGTSWPVIRRSAGAVSLTLTAGFASAAAEAPTLMAAVKMLMGHLFTNRQIVATSATAIEVPFAVEMLCRSYRPVNI